jgi:hypothetical protein
MSDSEKGNRGRSLEHGLYARGVSVKNNRYYKYTSPDSTILNTNRSLVDILNEPVSNLTKIHNDRLRDIHNYLVVNLDKYGGHVDFSRSLSKIDELIKKYNDDIVKLRGEAKKFSPEIAKQRAILNELDLESKMIGNAIAKENEFENDLYKYKIRDLPNEKSYKIAKELSEKNKELDRIKSLITLTYSTGHREVSDDLIKEKKKLEEDIDGLARDHDYHNLVNYKRYKTMSLSKQINRLDDAIDNLTSSGVSEEEQEKIEKMLNKSLKLKDRLQKTSSMDPVTLYEKNYGSFSKLRKKYNEKRDVLEKGKKFVETEHNKAMAELNKLNQTITKDENFLKIANNINKKSIQLTRLEKERDSIAKRLNEISMMKQALGKIDSAIAVTQNISNVASGIDYIEIPKKYKEKKQLEKLIGMVNKNDIGSVNKEKIEEAFQTRSLAGRVTLSPRYARVIQKMNPEKKASVIIVSEEELKEKARKKEKLRENPNG